MELNLKLRLFASAIMAALLLCGCDETEDVKEDKAPSRLAAYKLEFNIDGAKWDKLYSPTLPIDNQSPSGTYSVNDAFYMYFNVGIKRHDIKMTVILSVEMAMNGEPVIGKKYPLKNYPLLENKLQWKCGDDDSFVIGFKIYQASSWFKDEPALPEEYRDGYLGLVSSDIENGYIVFESITDSEYISGCKRVKCMIEGDIIAYPLACPDIKRRMELRDCRVDLYNVGPVQPQSSYEIWWAGSVIPFRPDTLIF